MVLPLAHDYQVKAALQKCEDWLLTEIEFIVGEVTGHTKETQEKVEFLAKCLLYGTKHGLRLLFRRALKLLVPYKLTRYRHTEFYKLLPEKNKRQLLEIRMVQIEETNSIGDGYFSEDEEEESEEEAEVEETVNIINTLDQPSEFRFTQGFQIPTFGANSKPIVNKKSVRS